MNQWLLIFGLLMAGSFLLSFSTVPLFRKLAFRWDILDHPGQRKIHQVAKPYLGGAAIFLSMYLLIGTGLLLAFNVLPASSLIPPSVQIYLPNIVKVLPRIFALLTGGAIIFALGILDDIKTLSPGIKFGGQFAAAILTVVMGIRLDLFMPYPWIAGALTVLWIVGMTNSFNFLDNMDGLSSGVAAIATFIFLWHSVLIGHMYMAVILSVFLGSILGFIPYNFPPSKIFMGDAGAMFIGFELGCLTVLNSYYYAQAPTFLPVLLPIFVLSVPLFDTISVVIIRIKNKQPVYIGDKNHFSHRLLALGLSQRQALLLIYLVTFCTGSGAILLPYLNLRESVIVLIQMIAIFAIITILEYSGRKNNPK